MTQTTHEERLEVYKEALWIFGQETQLVVALEELSEIQKEICKALRGFVHPAQLAEEVADATIMLEQLRYIFRYMDDMVVFGPNKKKLHKMRVQIEEWMHANGLEMKGNWQICKEDKEPLDFMGFRFWRDRTTLRRSIMLRITRRVRRVDKKGRWATPQDAAAVLSYMGWIYASDTHEMFLTWIKPHLHIQRMKNIVRRAQHEALQKRKHRKTTGMGHYHFSGSGVPQLQHCGGSGNR
ncbi:MAG: hypothetical protein MR888_01930 [Clostridiales bacterium]|nr:hypothetical protein [Clostridiales bacterium]